MFNVNLLACSHLSTLHNSSFRVSINFRYSCPSINTVVSSANKMENSKSEAREKLLTYKINSNGPKIEPYGTPWVNVFVSDLELPYCTY